MKKKWIFRLFLIIALIAMAGCIEEDKNDDDNENTPVVYYPKEFWGEWVAIEPLRFEITSAGTVLHSVYIDAGTAIYITSKDIRSQWIRFYYTYNVPSVKLEKISDRVIKLEFTYNYDNKERKRSVFLFPLRTATEYFTGNVVSFESDPRLSFTANRSVSGLGGIQMILTNLNDEAQAYTITTDENGDYSTSSTIPNEEYEVKIINKNGDDYKIPVTSPDSGGDIGTVTATHGLNFKVSADATSRIQGINQKDLYSGSPFDVRLNINNVGTQTATAAT